MANNRCIRWGILGTHWISDVMARAILDVPNTKLIAISGRNAEKTKKLASQYSIPKIYDHYEKLLKDPEVDVVYIGLPNHLHKEWMLHAARAGKHILCEKPLVLNGLEAEEVFAVVKENHVFCMEALMYFCHPFTQQLKSLALDKNKIGDMKLITAAYSAPIAELANPIAGGAMRCLGCYPLSLVRFLLQAEPVEIMALGQWDAKSAHDRVASAILKFEDGVIANISTADHVDMAWQLNVFGTKGSLCVKTNPWLPGKINEAIYKHHDMEEIVTVTANQPLYTYQIEVVNHHIRHGYLEPREHEHAISWHHSLGNAKIINFIQNTLSA